MSRIWCTVVIALLVMAARAPAHHSFAAEYDENKIIVVTGIVTKFEWTNPHAWLYVKGRDDAGRTGTWRFEMGSPGGLQSRGWKRTDVKPGDAVKLDGFAAKDGSKLANARNVLLPGGRRRFGGFACTPGSPVK